jgi:FkbM family methyltransferase
MDDGRSLVKAIARIAKIVRSRMPRGVDLLKDLHAELPWYRPEVILDVGAHVGESTMEFARWAPRARIECFEPSSGSFARLLAATKRLKGVRCNRVALGSRKGTARLAIYPSASETNSLLRQDQVAAEQEEVEVHTVLDYCSEAGIKQISLLKIDTEGNDLEVLKGAVQLLEQQRIDFVQVEAGMNPENDLHVPFGEFCRYLEPREYLLFALYEQVPEWPSGRINLRRANLVFVSRRLVELAAHRV